MPHPLSRPLTHTLPRNPFHPPASQGNTPHRRYASPFFVTCSDIQNLLESAIVRRHNLVDLHLRVWSSPRIIFSRYYGHQADGGRSSLGF